MATFVFHTVRNSGLADLFDALEEQHGGPLGVVSRTRVRMPRIRPPVRTVHGPTAGRPGRPGRPGGPGGFGGAVQAVAMAVGAAAVEILWDWRWYAIGGLGAYVVIRCVNWFRQRQRTLRVHRDVPISTAYLGDNADAKEILSAFLVETLKKEKLMDLDVYTTSSSFVSVHENTGPAMAFFCVEHLHLRVMNHVNCHAPDMSTLLIGLHSVRQIMIASANERDRNKVIEIGNASFCGLAKAGQAIGLYINQELGDQHYWDCCSQSVDEPVFVERSYDQMSYMAARRLSSAGTLLENMAGDPDFIIVACDGICNLLQNLALLQFAYQGVRNGMPLRPLCETLLELIQSSSMKTAIILIQFKLPPRHPRPSA